MNKYDSIYGMAGMSKEEFKKYRDDLFNVKTTNYITFDTVMMKSLNNNKKLMTLSSLLLKSKLIGRYGNMRVIDVESIPETLSCKQKPDELIHSSTKKIENSIVDSVIHSSVYSAGLI